MIIIAAYHLMLFFKRSDEKEYLNYAIINIICACYLSVFYIYELPEMPLQSMSFIWYQKIFSSSMPFLFPFLITSFVNGFLQWKENKSILAIRILFVVVLVILSLLFILARRFADFRRAAEDLNLHLENKVIERTMALSLANSKLAESNICAE